VAADESLGASSSWWSTTSLAQANGRVLYSVVGRVLTGGDGRRTDGNRGDDDGKHARRAKEHN
jgi:hypothetical protein